MQPSFEYRALYLPGFDDVDPDEAVDADSVGHLLRERTRTYNRLGAEGWELVAEHQNPRTFAVVATFRMTIQIAADAAGDAPAAEGVNPPAHGSEAATAGDRSYPILQPNGASPDSFRLVWDP